MPDPASPAKRRRHRVVAVSLLILGTLISACDSPPPAVPPAVSPAVPPSVTNYPLAAARIDLAKARLAEHAPDEALALLVSAIQADPECAEAITMATEILAKTHWHLPETTLRHAMPIDRIDFAPPSALWVSLTSGLNTTLLWDTESLAIKSVLFPIKETETRSLVFDTSHRSAILERAGITLLCDAQTMKPIRDIGLLPEFVTPSSTVIFSENGLLLAHPAFVSETDHSLVWQIRDSSSGDIIRSSEPIPATKAGPLAAFLDRQKLRVLNADGSLLEMPVSPVEDMMFTPPETPIHLLYAQFSEGGDSVLTLKLPKPHLDPEPFMLSLGGSADLSLEPAALLARFPWSRHPGLWTGLLHDPARSPLRVTGNSLFFQNEDHAPVHTDSPITAVAMNGDRLITGEESGLVAIHSFLPSPLTKTDSLEAGMFDGVSLAALGNLSQFLAGVSYDETNRRFVRRTPDERLSVFKNCDFEALLRNFPSLDFNPLVTRMQSFQPRTAGPEALALLTDRLSRATDDSEHPELVMAFDGADEDAVPTAIKSAGPNGSTAAKALELALDSTHPEWIDACLQQAENLPPLLRRIALSRIAWLQDRKADAISGWPDVFPDLKQVRLREDWDGWETADYSLALEKLHLCVSEELAALVVPENPTPEQRQAVIDRLSDPLTFKAVGRARFAHACLEAALALSAFEEDTGATFKLAATARQLGESPAPCLRAEAMSLTSLGDYQNARDRWVALITEHPVEDQLPGDYAEAAYTSFENADPKQAMAILTTGLHRFPNDANFALRAGWVALLTGNAERAYRFLLTGRQIGYPPEKLENATALLAIAAVQTGATEDAEALYQDLMLLDPAWEKPETIETLEWPDELKESLRQLTW